MGPMQKIFYFHVPTAWLLMISTLVAGGASLRYLFRGSARADRLALASGRAGCPVRPVRRWSRGRCGGGSPGASTGPGTPARPRTLLLWLLLIAYLLARKYGGPGRAEAGGRAGAVRRRGRPAGLRQRPWWRTLHPGDQRGAPLDPTMRPALYLSLLFLLILWGVLLAARLRLESLRAR